MPPAKIKRERPARRISRTADTPRLTSPRLPGLAGKSIRHRQERSIIPGEKHKEPGQVPITHAAPRGRTLSAPQVPPAVTRQEDQRPVTLSGTQIHALIEMHFPAPPQQRRRKNQKTTKSRAEQPAFEAKEEAMGAEQEPMGMPEDEIRTEAPTEAEEVQVEPTEAQDTACTVREEELELLAGDPTTECSPDTAVEAAFCDEGDAAPNPDEEDQPFFASLNEEPGAENPSGPLEERSESTAPIPVPPPQEPDRLPLESLWLEEGLEPSDLPEGTAIDPELGLIDLEESKDAVQAPAAVPEEAATAAPSESVVPIQELGSDWPDEAEVETLASAETEDAATDQTPAGLPEEPAEESDEEPAEVPVEADTDTFVAASDAPPPSEEPAVEAVLEQEDQTATALLEPEPVEIAARLEAKLDDITDRLAPLMADGGLEALLQGMSQTSGDDNPGLGAELDHRLAEIRASLEQLPRAAEDDGEIKRSIQDIKSSVEIAQAKRDILAGSLSMLSDDMKELRLQMAVTNKAALASAKTVQHVSEDLRARPENPGPAGGATAASAGQGLQPSTVIMGVGVLLLSWSLMFYFKTGNTHLALLGLVVANLAACAMILLARNEDE